MLKKYVYYRYYMKVKESVNQSANQSEQKKIVNFLDIDTSKITFSKPKPNKYNGTQIGVCMKEKHYL